jgi:malate dehydrogenase (oxaloacetate-decarboxylating)(NADP+)
VIEAGIAKAGLRMKPGRTWKSSTPPAMPAFRLRRHYQGGSEADVRASGSLLAALMVKAGDADAMLCGLDGNYDGHLAHVEKVIGLDGAQEFAA